MALTIEKAIIPLSITAAVIGIWAALRKPSQTPVVVQNSGGGGFTFPTVGLGGTDDDSAGVSPSTSQVTQAFASPTSQTPVGGPVNMVGSGVQGTPNYPSPLQSGPPYSYVGTLPGWKNQWLKRLGNAMGTSPAPDKKSGCSGGCGGCGSQSGCKSGSIVPAKIQDGSGDCYAPLYSVPQASPQQWGTFVSYSVTKSIIPNDPSAVGVMTDHLN